MSNRIWTPEQVLKAAPSVFQAEAHHSRSDEFKHVPTFEVLDALHQEGFRVTRAFQTRTRLADKREFTKHVVRLAHLDTLSADRQVGGSHTEILLTNAHDGGAAFRVELGVYRLVCSNGLVVGDVFKRESVRHVGHNVADKVIEGTYRVLEDAPLLEDRIQRWTATPVSTAQANELARRVAVERWGTDEAGNLQAPIYGTDQLLRQRRWDDAKNDAYTVINRIQENVIRGGLSGRSSSGRRQTTRAVTGVNENLRINRAIWNIAEEVLG